MLTLDKIAGRPWAIRADIAHHARDLYARGGFAALRELAGIKAAIHDPASEARHVNAPSFWHVSTMLDSGALAAVPVRAAAESAGGPRRAGLVARIPVIGVMTQRVEEIDSVFTRSSAEVAEEVLAAAAEPRVDAIVLEFDTPGGEVFGVPELWADIRRAAKAKPVVAAVNSVCASAGLYAASAADEIVVTPSGELGSLGVYAMHADQSKALEEKGVKLTFVVATNSPFKVEGNPTEPLGDDARAEIQKHVDRYMEMFERDVAKGRNVTLAHVKRDFGRGRMLSPQDAVAAKMADRVGTLRDAALRAAELARERGTSGRAGARAETPSLSPAAANAALRRLALL